MCITLAMLQTGLWGKTMRCVYNTGYAADWSVGEDDEMCVTITLAMLQTCLWGKTMRCVLL